MLRTAEPAAPRHSFYGILPPSYPQCAVMRHAATAEWRKNPHSNKFRQRDSPQQILLYTRCPHILTQPHSHVRKRRKWRRPMTAAMPPPRARPPPPNLPPDFQNLQDPQPPNDVCRRIRHPRAKIFAIDAAVTFDGRYMKQYQFDRCYETAWHGMKDMKILK